MKLTDVTKLKTSEIFEEIESLVHVGDRDNYIYLEDTVRFNELITEGKRRAHAAESLLEG